MENKKKTRKVKPKPLELEIIDSPSSSSKTKKSNLQSISSLTWSSSSLSSKKKRCKKGTKKFKPLGEDCFTQDEINAYKIIKSLEREEKKVSKEKKVVKRKTKKKMIEFEIVEEEVPKISSPIIPVSVPISSQEIIENNFKVVSPERNLKTPVILEIMEEDKPQRYNEKFIDLMEQLSSIMFKQGEPFRGRAYQKAQETIMAYPDDILSPMQLKGLPGIGSTIMEKLEEYVKTGTLRILEREKENPVNILGEIYGVGPKKAQELVKAGVKTIEDLRIRQNELLNDIQKTGLKYHDDIQQRIPRSEIEEYDHIFKSIFSKCCEKSGEDKFEIVGSYRRGALTSGDIDVIITGKTGSVYKDFIDELLKTGIIVEVLSRGQSKTLVICRLPVDSVARRVDFLYAPLDEYAFAILYFTGSKIFNTVMRQHGLNKGYTFNEHGIYNMSNKKKGEKVNKNFKTEKDIFDFLGLQYKRPLERKDGRSVVLKIGSPYMDVAEEEPIVPVHVPYMDVAKTSIKQPEDTFEIVPKPKNKTLKKKIIKKGKPTVELEIIEEPEHLPTESNILEIIQQFQHSGLPVLESLNEKQLTDIMRISSKKYYNQIPIMTDNQYDIVKEFIQQKYPNNLVINEIGAEVERNKATLPYEMASMDKIKPDTQELTKWMHKYSGPYVISAKLDGVSGLYTTEDKKPKLYTRGNGKVGQDISHLIPFLRLPKTKGLVIRGEFIIPKDVFTQKYSTKFANPRNMVAGLVNHKTINEAVNDLHFVAYEVIKPQLKPSEQMKFLGTLNIEPVKYELVETLSNEMLSQTLVDWRKNYIYEIDGIIVTDDKIYPRKSGNPEHAFAFKMILSDQVAEAKVVDVLWTPSKDGYLKPRVQIEPINLGGVQITYATGFNAKFIKDNKIGIGALIELIRSGDVIPHIKSVAEPATEAKMPDVPFQWNDTHVDIMLQNAAEDPTVKEKNITGFFRGIGVEGLSSGNILRLIKAGYDTVPKIIKMNEDDFLTVEGFKGKLANKIYTGIQQKIHDASIVSLMAASNIFGRGFSEKKMELIITELPDILVSKDSIQNKIKSVTSIKGMASKTAEAFVDKIPDFVSFIDECGLENKLHETPSKKQLDTKHPLFGKTIVLTGTRDKDIIDFLKNIGANQGTNVSKNTDFVIAKSKDEDTGKAEEARKLNIPILSIDEFKQNFNL